MRASARTGAIVVAIVVLAALPASASAAVDVTRSAEDVVRVTGGDGVDDVTIARDEAGRLVVSGAGAPGVVSSDLTCVVDEAGASATCDAPAGGVTVDLGSGADVLRVATGGSVTVDDATATDIVDLSSAEGALAIRWQRARQRLVAACSTGCERPWSVALPVRPGQVRTGSGDDVVDLRAWRVPGRTTWLLGAGRDRFEGAPSHRSTVLAGADADQLVSNAAIDVLQGEAGTDKLADFGGAGDRLLGGAGVDAVSSMDGRRDVLDGGPDRDMCLTPRGHDTSWCDTGPARRFEMSRYLPLTTRAWVLRMLGIR